MVKRNPYYQGPVTARYDGLQFSSPGEPGTDRSLRDIIRWKSERSAAEWPRAVPVRPTVPEARIDGLRTTMVGHATLLIQVAGLNILTDPVWSKRVSPLLFAGPSRVTEPGIAFEDLPPIDVVLLSHNHYDHMDITTMRRLHARDAPLVVTPLGNDVILRSHIEGIRIEAGDWGDCFSVKNEADVHIVPANHWSSRSLMDRRMALWGGFMVKTSCHLIYFAGDTGYGTGSIFRAMRDRYGCPDLAIIPIGAYAPEWFMAAQHCNPEDAVRIMLHLGASHAIGIHWGTYQLTDEARMEPVDRLRAELLVRSIDSRVFTPIAPGEVWNAI